MSFETSTRETIKIDSYDTNFLPLSSVMHEVYFKYILSILEVYFPLSILQVYFLGSKKLCT